MGSQDPPETGILSEHWLQRRIREQKRPTAEIQIRKSVQHHCKEELPRLMQTDTLTTSELVCGRMPRLLLREKLNMACVFKTVTPFITSYGCTTITLPVTPHSLLYSVHA